MAPKTAPPRPRPTYATYLRDRDPDAPVPRIARSEPPFLCGDRVRLVTGGPVMVIEGFVFGDGPDDIDRACVVWFDAAELREGRIGLAALVLVKRPRVNPPSKAGA